VVRLCAARSVGGSVPVTAATSTFFGNFSRSAEATYSAVGIKRQKRIGLKPSFANASTSLNAVDRAGLKDVHFHDLRCSFATRKVAEGWDRNYLKAITGHRTDKVFARYNKPSLKTLRAVVEGAPSLSPSRSVGKRTWTPADHHAKCLISLYGEGWGPVASPVFKTELRGVTLRGWFDSIPSPPYSLPFCHAPHLMAFLELTRQPQKFPVDRGEMPHHGCARGSADQRRETERQFSRLRSAGDERQ